MYGDSVWRVKGCYLEGVGRLSGGCWEILEGVGRLSRGAGEAVWRVGVDM